MSIVVLMRNIQALRLRSAAGVSKHKQLLSFPCLCLAKLFLKSPDIRYRFQLPRIIPYKQESI
jgi:hypothetical protein